MNYKNCSKNCVKHFAKNWKYYLVGLVAIVHLVLFSPFLWSQNIAVENLDGADKAKTALVDKSLFNPEYAVFTTDENQTVAVHFVSLKRNWIFGWSKEDVRTVSIPVSEYLEDDNERQDIAKSNLERLAEIVADGGSERLLSPTTEGSEEMDDEFVFQHDTVTPAGESLQEVWNEEGKTGEVIAGINEGESNLLFNQKDTGIINVHNVVSGSGVVYYVKYRLDNSDLICDNFVYKYDGSEEKLFEKENLGCASLQVFDDKLVFASEGFTGWYDLASKKVYDFNVNLDSACQNILSTLVVSVDGRGSWVLFNCKSSSPVFAWLDFESKELVVE